MRCELSGVAPQPQGILALPVNQRTRMFTMTSNEALRDWAPARECPAHGLTWQIVQGVLKLCRPSVFVFLFLSFLPHL